MDLDKVRVAEMPFGPGDLSAITAKSCLVAGWHDELCGETLVNGRTCGNPTPMRDC